MPEAKTVYQNRKTGRRYRRETPPANGQRPHLWARCVFCVDIETGVPAWVKHDVLEPVEVSK